MALPPPPPGSAPHSGADGPQPDPWSRGAPGSAASEAPTAAGPPIADGTTNAATGVGSAVPLTPRKRRWPLLLSFALVAWVAALIGAVVGERASDWFDRPPQRPSEQPLDVADARGPIEQRVDVAAVANFIKPSVVTISADQPAGTSVGTGVILTEDGEILTNAHVIANASQVRVRLAGETEPRRARVLAADAGNDLALLRIDGDGYAAATFADPESIRIGDEVVAIGFALGLDGEPSVTLGIVSALDRTLAQNDIFLDGLIQTDASISSGNSGGPLVNAAGEVVGINTAVIRDRGTIAATNVSFAISVGEALPVVADLREAAVGNVRTEAFLGVGLADRTDGGQGAVVTAVQADTPAAAVGVLDGDLIVAVDGAATDGTTGLIAAIRDREPGDDVRLTIVRGGDRIELDVTLTERPDDGN